MNCRRSLFSSDKLSEYSQLLNLFFLDRGFERRGADGPIEFSFRFHYAIYALEVVHENSDPFLG